MDVRTKVTAITLGAICSIALVGGSVFAMGNNGAKSGVKAPTVSTKGDGKSYSREELAKKLGLTLEEFDKQVQANEFPITGSSKISGRVENGVHTLIDSTKEK